VRHVVINYVSQSWGGSHSLLKSAAAAISSQLRGFTKFVFAPLPTTWD
jgi:hypothetical protein